MKSKIGEGIYTTSDISKILLLQPSKVRRWVNNFWDKKFSQNNSEEYSWNEGKEKYVNFYTFIEIYVFDELLKLGLSYKSIITAHIEISQELNLLYPFANSKMLVSKNNIFYYLNNETLVKADKTKQIGIKGIIENLYEKIDLNSEKYAERFWPLGKETSIVIDPHHQFGQPTISGTNILANTLYSYYKGGESVETIANLYEINTKQVSDAITYMTRKVA